MCAGLGLCLLLCSCEILAPLDDVNADAALSRPVCEALPAQKVKSVPPSGTGPDWTVVLVPYAGEADAAYIDKTEVTVEEYQPWADANAGSFTSWHPWCQWKDRGPSNPSGVPADACSTSIPTNQPEPFARKKPIRCVDWCDAEAFCRTARGGRLCYVAAGGGAVAPEGRPDEWKSACSNRSRTVWPWGDTSSQPNICNLGQQAGCGASGFTCGPAPVQTFRDCRNESGAFDLIGNVAEWADLCGNQSLSDSTGSCITMGGSYADSLERLSCGTYFSNFPKSSRSPAVGIRCCYDLTPLERQTCGLP
jgi:sulfatase modifying factor 1